MESPEKFEPQSFMPVCPKLPKGAQKAKPARTGKDEYPRYPLLPGDDPIDFYLRVRKADEMLHERPKSVNRQARIKKEFMINSK